MFRYLLFFAFVMLMAACYSSSSRKYHDARLTTIRIGMSYIEVLDSIGAPDTVLHRGTVLDEFGNQTKTDEWYYSADQMILMINDTVNAIDLHVSETQQRIRYMIDSARAAEERK